MEKSLALAVRLRPGQSLVGGQGLCLGPTGLEKALGVVGMWLRLNATEGAQVCLWSWRAGDPAWELSRLPGPEWVGPTPSTLSCSCGPRGPLPPASPVLPWPPSYPLYFYFLHISKKMPMKVLNELDMTLKFTPFNLLILQLGK